MAAAAAATVANERERGQLEKLAGRLLIILTLISFVFVGLLVNCLQLVLVCTQYLSRGRRWRQWHKTANGNLVHALFIQPTYLIYAWSRVKLNIVLADARLVHEVRKPLLGVLVANHTFELDWLACFVLADQLGNMGAYKSFTKEELKYLPIIGWAFWMSDLIYVKRNWRLDKPNIGRQLDELLWYEQALLGIFAEGTRYTPEKYASSCEFARSIGLKPYRHHLVPRARGFNFTLRHYLRKALLEDALDRRMLRLFNLELVIPGRRQFVDFLNGRQIRVDVYCEEVELEESVVRETLLSPDEDHCPKLTELLRAIYRRKDELMDEYEANGGAFVPNTPLAGYFPIRRPVRPMCYWLFGMCLTYGTLACLVRTTAAVGVVWLIVVTLVISGVLMLKRIQRESRVHQQLLSSQTDTYGRPLKERGERRPAETPATSH